MIYHGDCRAVLKTLPEQSVHCVVTSPPYFGLRDYGVDGQIGLEPQPDAYVAKLVEVFREVRRVLTVDGTVWLNIGDCYAGSGRGGYAGGRTGLEGSVEGQDQSRLARGSQLAAGFHEHAMLSGAVGRAWVAPPTGLKCKDLIGVPWMLAFALRADGWWLRSNVIWHKPNPMPESVTDRPTKAHEDLFLLTRSERYYYDADAIREPYAESTLREAATGYTGTATKEYAAGGAQDPSETKRRVQESIRRRVGMVKPYESKHAEGEPQDAGRRMLLNLKAARDAGGAHGNPFGKGANKRTVWSIATQPFPGAHFAVMPEALVEPCIRAGCPPGGTVLDPFAGAGTVGVVAAKLQRQFVGIELNPDYIAIAEHRIAAVAPLFAEPKECA